MLTVPLPFTDAALYLSPRWAEQPAWAQAAALLLLVAVPVALVGWLYSCEMRLVRRPVALALLAVRLLVLLLLLALVGGQPIVARTATERLPGRVVVAVDRSASMAIADPQRPAAAKLRLARALKLNGDDGTVEELDGWLRQYAERDGPQWVGPDEHPGEPERRRRLESERRQRHDRVCRRVDALTRGEIARRVLADDGLGLLGALAARHEVELLGFAQEAWDEEPGQPAAPADPGTGTPGAHDGTDLRPPLTRALERAGPERGKVLGVVLLTDGQHNRGPSPVARAIELGQHGLPVYPVALGAVAAPPDVALAAVQAPAAVFKDVDVPVEARFKVSGLPAQEIRVELRAPGQLPLQQRLRHDGNDRDYTVRFQVRLDRAGTQALELAAAAVPGETRADNNGRPVVVNVADDKARVLLIDGEARWEYHYLANALARDRAVQLQSVVFAQPRLGKVAEDELGKLGHPALALPADPEALAGYDCLVLGDVPPARLPLAERRRLEKYVADRGGTLVVLAGKRAMPLAFAPLADADDPLARLLPVLEAREVRPDKGFPVALTHEGRLAPFLQLDPAPDRSERRWAELPRHFWGVVGRPKPGAVALAAFTDAEAAAAKTDSRDRDGELALIARQNYGFGRVLFVGLDGTWRWRYKVGDAYHHRFWGQLVRWAAADKPLVVGNEHVRFGTREPVYRQGQEVDLTVRLGEQEKPLGADALAGARVLRLADDGPGEAAVALVPLARRPAQPRVLEGRLRDLPPGRYAVELAVPDLADRLLGPTGPDGQPTRLRATFTVTPPDSAEMIELATNHALLAELAARSGGRSFTPENATELADLLVNRAVTREVRTERKLWQDWTTLALFLALLTVEWVGRKLVGLP